MTYVGIDAYNCEKVYIEASAREHGSNSTRPPSQRYGRTANAPMSTNKLELLGHQPANLPGAISTMTSTNYPTRASPGNHHAPSMAIPKHDKSST